METSIKGKMALAASEGIVVTPYLDSVGVWTLGIGHTAYAGPPQPSKYKDRKYTVPEIMELFDKDISKYENAVNRYINISLEQHEFDALIHFTYNVGPDGLRVSKLRQKLNNGEKVSGFKTGFHGWLKPKSLLERRDKERDMALYGDYKPFKALLYDVNEHYKPIPMKSVNLEEIFLSEKLADSDEHSSEGGDTAETKNPLYTLLRAIYRIFKKLTT